MEKFALLYVDDEESNLRIFKDTFRRKYDIFTAVSAKEGMEILDKNDIDLVLSDQRMPEMTGVEFLKYTLEKYPEPNRILITGYSDFEAIENAINHAKIFQYIQKPWEKDKLSKVIENALKIYQLECENKKQKQDLIKAKEKIEESEERYKVLSNASFEAIFISEKGFCTEQNKTAAKMFGYSHKEAIGMFATDIFTDESKEIVKTNIFNGNTQPYDVIALRKDGTTFDAEIQGVNFLYEGKKLRITAIRNITTRKQIEKTLNQQSLFINTLHDYLKVGIVACDAAGTLTYFNKATQEFHGLPQTEIQPEKWADHYDLYFPDGKTKMQKKDIPLFRALEGEQFNDIEMMIVPKQGKPLTLAASGRTMCDKEGKKQGAVVAMYDISERIKEEKELKIAKDKVEESEKNYRGLFDNVNNAIYIQDKDGYFLDVNQGVIEMYGYPKEYFIGKTPEFLSAPGRNDLTKIFKIINNAFSGKAQQFDFWGIRKNGEVFPKIVRTQRDTYFGENVVVTFAIDITERKKSEAELIKSKQKAEESDQLKTEFIHNMSHEIRTPLNGILGFSRILNKPNLTDIKKKQSIKIIKYSSNQLMRIIVDILEISKLGTKQVNIFEKEISLNDLLLEQFLVFDIKAKENKTPLYLNKGLSDNESTILVDEVILNTILSNLLENALKFTSEGFIEYGYNIVNNKIEIYVKDTGIGIKTESQKIIFERFSQEEKELSKKVGGLGLGLSIAKENAELLGGKITLKSEKGKGASFFVTIPYKPVSAKQEKISEQKSAIGNHQSSNKEYTILIVEDEEVNYLYLKILLKDEINLNCKILYAKNGKEAVNLCKENTNIDFILMDLKMPIMTGFEATKLIKKIRPDLQIVAQTAYTLQTDKDKAYAAGCDGFISKPISKELLSKTINKYLITK